jgi:hypothetical protein
MVNVADRAHVGLDPETSALLRGTSEKGTGEASYRVLAAPKRARARTRRETCSAQPAQHAQGYSQIHIFTFDQSVPILSANGGGVLGDPGSLALCSNQAASRLSARGGCGSLTYRPSARLFRVVPRRSVLLEDCNLVDVVAIGGNDDHGIPPVSLTMAFAGPQSAAGGRFRL